MMAIELRRLRWSLAALVLLIAAAAGTVGYQRYKQAWLVRQIESAGGSVSFHRPGPRRSMLGPMFESPLVSVDVGRGGDPDAVLQHAARLRHVDNLWIIDTHVSEHGLRHLPQYGPLLLLSVQKTPLTDGDLQHIARMRQLDCLMVIGTKTTAAGLRSLRRSLPRTEILVADDVLDAQANQFDDLPE